jgi:Mce-associated membrane protein
VQRVMATRLPRSGGSARTGANRSGSAVRSTRVGRTTGAKGSARKAESSRARPPKKPDLFQRQRTTWIAVTVVLTLLLLASMIGASVWGVQWYRDREMREGQQEAVAAARQTVVDFFSISASTVDRDVEQVIQGATGTFKEEYESGKEELRTAVIENKVRSEGKVLRAGLVRGDADSARVLVAADANVKNANSPKGRKVHYRVQVEMSYDEKSDRWQVADLKFVG